MAGRTVRLTHCVQAVSYYSLLNSFLYLPCADFYIASSELCRESRQQFRMQVSDCPISSPACLDQQKLPLEHSCACRVADILELHKWHRQSGDSSCIHHGTHYRTAGGCSFSFEADWQHGVQHAGMLLPDWKACTALHLIHGPARLPHRSPAYTPQRLPTSLPTELMPCFTSAPLYYDTINLEDMHAGKDALFR